MYEANARLEFELILTVFNPFIVPEFVVTVPDPVVAFPPIPLFLHVVMLFPLAVIVAVSDASNQYIIEPKEGREIPIEYWYI